MKIIIIDDEIEICQSVKNYLQRKNTKVDCSHNGEEGLWKIKKRSYDLIILDYKLPNIDGISVCRKLRKEKYSTPILMLTAIDEMSNKISALHEGVDDYLVKPFSMDELYTRISALLKKREASDSNLLKVKNLELDLKKHKLVIEKKEIKLTNKEFYLLKYLIENKDILISRNMLLEKIWEMRSDPFSNTIESHISSLRKKIKDPDQNIIKTVPGKGYILSD